MYKKPFKITSLTHFYDIRLYLLVYYSALIPMLGLRYEVLPQSLGPQLVDTDEGDCGANESVAQWTVRSSTFEGTSCCYG